jgi:hypothetical protein
VKAGNRIQQSVSLELSGNVRPILPVNVGRPPQLSISTTPVFQLPPLGLCVASHRHPLSPPEIERLKALQLSHLRVDLRLGDPDYPKVLEQATAEANALGTGLHVAIVLGGAVDQELPALLQRLGRANPRPFLDHSARSGKSNS